MNYLMQLNCYTKKKFILIFKSEKPTLSTFIVTIINFFFWNVLQKIVVLTKRLKEN